VSKKRRTVLRNIATISFADHERFEVYADHLLEGDISPFPLSLARIFHYPECEGSVYFSFDERTGQSNFSCQLCHHGVSMKKPILTLGALRNELARQQAH
jgi:hypothetical protein